MVKGASFTKFSLCEIPNSVKISWHHLLMIDPLKFYPTRIFIYQYTEQYRTYIISHYLLDVHFYQKISRTE